MATTIGDNVVVIDQDDDFVKAGYPIPEREPLIAPTLVRRVGDDGAPFARSASAAWWTGTSSERVRAHLLPPARMDRGRRGRRARHRAHPHQPRRSRPTHPDDVRVLQRRGLYIVEQPVAALYGVGKTSGVAVDVGYAVTDVAPVVDGAVVTPAAQRRRVGSSASRRLRALGDAAAKLSDADVDAARDAVCVVAPARDGTQDGTQSAPPDTTFTLPDGNVLRVPGAAGWCAATRRSIPGGRRGNLRRARRGGGGVHAGPRRVCLDAVNVSGWWAGGAGRRAGARRARAGSGGRVAAQSETNRAGAPEYMPEGAAMYPAWFGGGARQGGVRAAAARVEDRVSGERADGDDGGGGGGGGRASPSRRRRRLRGNRRLWDGRLRDGSRVVACYVQVRSTTRKNTHTRSSAKFRWERRLSPPTNTRKKYAGSADVLRGELEQGRGDDNRGVDDDTRR